MQSPFPTSKKTASRSPAAALSAPAETTEVFSPDVCPCGFEVSFLVRPQPARRTNKRRQVPAAKDLKNLLPSVFVLIIVQFILAVKTSCFKTYLIQDLQTGFGSFPSFSFQLSPQPYREDLLTTHQTVSQAAANAGLSQAWPPV